MCFFCITMSVSGCFHSFSGVHMVIMFRNNFLCFALSILYEFRRRNYALVASI